MAKWMEELKNLRYTIFHPFVGFYEMKFRKKGSMALATALLVLYGLVSIFNTQYTGFIFNTFPLHEMRSVQLFLLAVVPIVLFIVSNWSTTSLMNGSGNIRDIWMMTCYSLVPLILFDFTTTLLSNVVILEEGPIVTALNYIGVVWFCYLIFTGLCTIHEYTVSRNILTLLVTLVAAIIIIFLVVLYFTLMQTVIGFISTISAEISKRW
ncbi:MAG: YIP1 family protein [Lachnospiraceae bacterium]|nr:YIP1 family protein [Lachnospiraceae bacterium]